MLSNKLKRIYFAEDHAMILPEEKGEDNLALAATVSANFASLGMTMTKEMTENLSHASKDDIISFYKEYAPMIREQIGSFQNAKQFYANFPEEVLDKSRAEIWIDQILSYYTAGNLVPSDFEQQKESFPFIGEVQAHLMKEGSEKGFEALMTRTMRSAVSFTPRQVNNIKAFFEERKDAARFAPKRENLKQKENMIILGMLQIDATGESTLLHSYIQDPGDVLRYAAVRSVLRDAERKGITLSDEERTAAYQKASLQYNKDGRPSFILSRQDRRICAMELEKISKGNPEKLAVEMYRHRQDWKRLIKNVHITNFKAPTVAKAFQLVCDNVSIDRHDKTVEEAIKKDDLKTALFEAATRPGDLIGRADKFLRMAKTPTEQEMVVGAIRGCVQKAGIAKTVGLLSSIKGREVEDTSRSFVIAKSGKTFQTEEKNRKALDKNIIDEIHDACIDGLGEKFKGKDPMGKVYMSLEMEYYAVPKNTRNQSDAVETYPTGSRIALDTEKTDILRLFDHWTNMDDSEVGGDEWLGGKSNVINDLSAMLYTDDGKLYGFVGWNGNFSCKNVANEMQCVFSGDMTNGGPKSGAGVADYIDCDLKKLKEGGIRYVVVSVASYCHQKFKDQPNTSFGVMMRSSDDYDKKYSGEQDVKCKNGMTFEPQTVLTKARLTCDAEQAIPAIIDTYESRMIWVDMAARGHMMSNSPDIGPTLDNVRKQSPMSLADLISANVKGNGEFVNDIKEADKLFITVQEEKALRDAGVSLEGKEIIHPTNLSYITGVLMTEPEKIAERPEKEHIEVKEVIEFADPATIADDYEVMANLERSDGTKPENTSTVADAIEQAGGNVSEQELAEVQGKADTLDNLNYAIANHPNENMVVQFSKNARELIQWAELDKEQKRSKDIGVGYGED